MEFYASWCPACKHFQPHYEKVSAFFYGSPRPKPEVYVARVDCATEVCNISLHLPQHPLHPTSSDHIMTLRACHSAWQ